MCALLGGIKTDKASAPVNPSPHFTSLGRIERYT
jgi:hypothetical protein